MELTEAEKLMTFLLAPQIVPRPSSSSLPSSENLSALVEKHNLPLDEVITVNELTEDPLVNSECMKQVLQLDRERHQCIRDEFIAFRKRLDEAKIPYVLLKAVHGVPYRSSNIDILLPERDFGRIDRILVESGYLYNALRPAHYKMLYDRVSSNRPFESGIIHVHKCISWYSAFIEPEAIFSTAVSNKETGVRMPGTEVALAIIGCHAIYEDACVKFIDLHKILCLLNRGPVDWDWLWKFAEDRGFASGLALFFLILDRQHRTYIGQPLFNDELINQMESHLSWLDGTKHHYQQSVAGRDLLSPYRISKYFVRRCLFVQLKRCQLMDTTTKIAIGIHILRHGVSQVTRIFLQPPMLMAICGPDGCGKTTQVERVANAIKTFEIKSVCSWVRIGDSPLLNFLKAPFRRRVRAEVDAGKISEQGVFKSSFVRAVWPVVAVADYVVRQYAAISVSYLRQRVVIADRYHVDALVDLAMRCGPDVLKKRWVVAAMRLLPKAQPAFVLQVPNDTLSSRRREEHIEGISNRQGAYYSEAVKLMQAKIISGNDSIETITELMTREFLGKYFKKFDARGRMAKLKQCKE
jgi:thymidylate kinase